MPTLVERDPAELGNVTVLYIDQRIAAQFPGEPEFFDRASHGCAGLTRADDVDFPEIAQPIPALAGDQRTFFHAHVAQHRFHRIGCHDGRAENRLRLTSEPAFRLHWNRGRLRMASTATDGSSSVTVIW